MKRRESQQPVPSLERRHVASLQEIPNVGPATAGDLQEIGIVAPDQLCGRDPVALYDQLCTRRGTRIDPCMLDILISAVRYMDGAPAKSWWHYTAERKQLLEQRAARDNDANEDGQRIGRRAWLRNGVLLLAGSSIASLEGRWAGAAGPEKPAVRFGVVTDLHYADKPAAGTRYYRQTLEKLAEAVQQFRRQSVQFTIELGDFIDAADTLQTEKGYLRTVHRAFSKPPGPQHYVLGNHCVYSLTKGEFLGIVGQQRSFYSFDADGIHFVVLDACFRHDMQPYGRRNFQWTDANIPPAQLKWLEDDLDKTSKPTIVFVHQRLDVAGHYGVKNAPNVRAIFERAGNVRAVFQGHYHRNDYRNIGDIHYVTLVAMVEGSGAEHNGYSVVSVHQDAGIQVTGFRTQKSYKFGLPE